MRYNKDMKKTGQVITDILSALCVYFAVISLAAVLALGARFLYYFDIKALNIPYDSGLSEEEVRLNYDAMIDYFKLSNDEKFSLPTLKSSEQGAAHFADTKVIFRVFQYGLIVSAACGAALVVLKAKQRRFGFLKYSGIALFSTMGVVAFAVAFDWEETFVLFHKLFFNNDFWLFDAEFDPVITILPEEYFLHCALLIAAVILIGAVLCLWVYGRKKDKHNRKI